MALINPSLVAAASPSVTGLSGQAQRKANAESYAAAMKEAARAPEPVARMQDDAASGGQAIAREAPFGVERPRYQRPGALLDIRV